MSPELSTAGFLLERPALEARLDTTFGKRLTTVVAGPGYGKTTLLAQWSRDIECAWYTVSSSDIQLGSFIAGLRRVLGSLVEDLSTDGGSRLTVPDDSMRASALAAHLASQLERSLEHDFVLILDDAHELGESPSAQLVEGLVRQAPPILHVVLASRAEPRFRIQRLRGQGQVLELEASELAFTDDEVADLVQLSLGADARTLAPRLSELTEGWPVAVRLAVGTLERVDTAEREDVLERLRRPEGPLLAYLAEEVFERESPAVRELIRSLAPFERFTPELCEALGATDSREAIESLRRQGLFLMPHRSGPGFFSLHALVREFAQEQLPLDTEELRELHRRAAGWFEKEDLLEEALTSHVESADEADLARFLAERGEDLLARGSIEPVITAGDSLSPRSRDARVEEIVGEAHSLKGGWEEALACYQRAAGDRVTLPPGLAWRMGRLYWDRGRLEEAAAEYERGRVDGSSLLEEAFLLAWMSMPQWNFGNVEAARELAERSLEAADASGSLRAAAAAHNALAVTYLGQDHALFERHNAAAREAAETAGDVLQLMRSAITQAGPAEPREGIQILETPIRLAELAGASLYLAGLLNSRGSLHYALGHFDDSVADHRRAFALFEAHGSSRRSWSLSNLGAIALERGDLAFARAACDEGLEASAGDAQGLIDLRRRLAHVLAYEDPREARRLADAALEVGRQLGYMLGEALISAGWVALARSDREVALAYGREAAAETQRQRLRLEFAEALELQAMASPDPANEIGLLEEAAAIWRDSGNEVALARNELAVARLTHDRTAAERARRKLRAAGVREQASGAAGLLASLPPEQPDPARVRTLGTFAVVRAGQPVAIGEWRSRKARDLLKILVGRRGRVAPREYLMDALWPGEDPKRLGNRLSVALSVLRSVLDPDKRLDPEHFVAGGKAGVALRLENLPIDVEDLLADAEAGLNLLREGRENEARERLLAAEAAYAGDFLEEDAYEEWAATLREEARVTYIDVAHALAGLARADGDLEGAARYLLRVLERDSYDERAHLGLVQTLVQGGHHGEARRCYAAYAARMDEIGVEAALYPAANAPGSDS